MSSEAIFSAIYRHNTWGGSESVSGRGSELGQTRRVIRALPALCRDLGVQTLLDIPCGDFHWMQHVDRRGIDYIGADIVPDLIAGNWARHAGPGVRFTTCDLLRDSLPAADLVLCRDCLVHLSHCEVRTALSNIAASEARYLLTTTFPGRHNTDIATGGWRPLDLASAPFNLPPPRRLIREGCDEFDGAYRDKSLGLWPVADLRRHLAGTA